MSTSINKPYPASMISSILNKLKRPNMSQTCHTWHVTWPRPVSECYQPALLGGKCHPVSVVTHSLVTWDWTHSGLDSDTHSCLRAASVVIYSWLLLSSRWIQQQECRQFIKAANDGDVSDGECLCLCWGVVGHSRGEVWPPRVLLAADVQPAAHPPPLPRLPGGGEGGGAALHGGQEALRSEAPDARLQPLPSHVQRLDISRSGRDLLPGLTLPVFQAPRASGLEVNTTGCVSLWTTPATQAPWGPSLSPGGSTCQSSSTFSTLYSSCFAAREAIKVEK